MIVKDGFCAGGMNVFDRCTNSMVQREYNNVNNYNINHI